MTFPQIIKVKNKNYIITGNDLINYGVEKILNSIITDLNNYNICLNYIEVERIRNNLKYKLRCINGNK